MQKYITILLLLTCSLCYGQGKYKTCTAKTFDSRNKIIATTKKSFNKYGKVVLDSTHSNDYWLSNITWFRYINDTLLAEKLTASGTGDSNRVWYYYDTKNRLIETRTNSYERQVKSCLISEDDIKEWGDTIIKRYTYNQHGQVEEEIIQYKKNIKVNAVIGAFGSGWHVNRIVYEYDASYRLISEERQHIYRLNDRDVQIYGDSEIRKPGEPWSINDMKRGYPDTFSTEIITYKYSKDKLIKTSHDLDHSCYTSVIIEYSFDSKKRVIAELEYEKAGIRRGSKMRYYKYNPDKCLYKEMEIIPNYNTGNDDYQTTLYAYE